MLVLLLSISDQGKPLGEKDFSLASQLPIIPLTETTKELMKIMEDGELKGAQNTDDMPPSLARNGLEPIM